ncbi:MAG: hypothetical protein QXL54_00200 [Candidatus Bathyarchaeia archaeon]
MSEDEPVFIPSDFIRYIAKTRNVPAEAIKVPERLIFTYQPRIYEDAKNFISGKPVDWWVYCERQPFCIGRFNNVDVGLGCFWVGAPAVAMTPEEVIACDAEKSWRLEFRWTAIFS